MLPPENTKRSRSETVKSGEGLATALFYLALGLLTIGGTLGVVSRSIRYASLHSKAQVQSGSVILFRRELAAKAEARDRRKPLLVLIDRSVPAFDRALQKRLACCVLYLLLAADEEFGAVPGRPEFSGATEGLPYYAALDFKGTFIASSSSLDPVLEAAGFPDRPAAR